jgi:uncharacterized protein (TIGR00661 family)
LNKNQVIVFMRILYALQGTGYGHISRAKEIIPLLKQKAQVDVLLSGYKGNIQLPFHLDYQLKGMHLVYSKNGGVDVKKTFQAINFKAFLAEIKSLDLSCYQLVLNDFEPVSAWWCYMKGNPCISLSHQAAVAHKSSPREGKDLLGRFILSHFAPATHSYGFHFQKYDKQIFHPVIREEIRNSKPSELDHNLVYLPSYSDKKLLSFFSQFRNDQWHIFSTSCPKPYRIENLHFIPVNHELFAKSLASAKGVICGAGFETPAEALYLHKKLLVCPMKRQYEQSCNAAALGELGVPIIRDLDERSSAVVKNWIANSAKVDVVFENQIDDILNQVIKNHYQELPIASVNTKE